MPAMSAPFRVEPHANDLFVLITSRCRGSSHPVACLGGGIGPCRAMAETGPFAARAVPRKQNDGHATDPGYVDGIRQDAPSVYGSIAAIREKDSSSPQPFLNCPRAVRIHDRHQAWVQE